MYLYDRNLSCGGVLGKAANVFFPVTALTPELEREVIFRLRKYKGSYCARTAVTMLRQLLTFLCFAWALAQDTDDLEIDAEFGPFNPFPFLASVEDRGSIVCGSTIISDTWVLTAASCVVNTTAENLAVRVGSNRAGTGGSLRNVTVALYHHDYDPVSNDYNVALLQLSRPLLFQNNVRAVLLAEQDFDPANQTQLTVVGWGATTNTDQIDGILYMGTTTVLDRAVCNGTDVDTNEITENRMIGRVTRRMICSLHGEPCRHDTGGPVLLGDSLQVGVMSLPPGNCFPENKPFNSVLIGSVRSWIVEKTGV